MKEKEEKKIWFGEIEDKEDNEDNVKENKEEGNIIHGAIK